jgi:hypothetical protein
LAKFTLDAETLQTMADGFDSVFDIKSNTCKLVYPPKLTPCNNCIFDAIGKKSANRYLNGGPIPFPNNSNCPLCGGVGTIATEVSELSKMICQQTPPTINRITGEMMNIPAGYLWVHGYATVVPKLLRCSYLIPYVEIDPNSNVRYKLEGLPTVYCDIISGRYFKAYLKMIP